MVLNRCLNNGPSDLRSPSCVWSSSSGNARVQVSDSSRNPEVRTAAAECLAHLHHTQAGSLRTAASPQSPLDSNSSCLLLSPSCVASPTIPLHILLRAQVSRMLTQDPSAKETDPRDRHRTYNNLRPFHFQPQGS